MVSEVVGVRFARAGKVEYFDPSGLELSAGDEVLVETEDGPREGRVVIAPAQVVHSDLRGPLEPVLSKAGGAPVEPSKRASSGNGLS